MDKSEEMMFQMGAPLWSGAEGKSELAELRAERDRLMARNMELQSEIERMRLKESSQPMILDKGCSRWELAAAKVVNLRIAAEDAANGCREAMRVGLEECERLRRNKQYYLQLLFEEADLRKESDRAVTAAMIAGLAECMNLRGELAVAQRRIEEHEDELHAAVTEAVAGNAKEWREAIETELQPLHAHGLPEGATLRQAVRWMRDVLGGMAAIREEACEAAHVQQTIEEQLGKRTPGLRAGVSLLIGRMLTAEQERDAMACRLAKIDAEQRADSPIIDREELGRLAREAWYGQCPIGVTWDELTSSYREDWYRASEAVARHVLAKSGRGLEGDGLHEGGVALAKALGLGYGAYEWPMLIATVERLREEAANDSTLDGVGRHDAYLVMRRQRDEARAELEKLRKAIANGATPGVDVVDTCSACGWQGDIVDEDRCPECKRENVIVRRWDGYPEPPCVAVDNVRSALGDLHIKGESLADTVHELIADNRGSPALCHNCANGHRGGSCAGMRAVRVGAGACVIDGACECACREQQAVA